MVAVALLAKGRSEPTIMESFPANCKMQAFHGPDSSKMLTHSCWSAASAALDGSAPDQGHGLQSRCSLEKSSHPGSHMLGKAGPNLIAPSGIGVGLELASAIVPSAASGAGLIQVTRT